MRGWVVQWMAMMHCNALQCTYETASRCFKQLNAGIRLGKPQWLQTKPRTAFPQFMSIRLTDVCDSHCLMIRFQEVKNGLHNPFDAGAAKQALACDFGPFFFFKVKRLTFYITFCCRYFGTFPSEKISLVWEHQWWGDSTCTVDLALLDWTCS